MKPRKSECKQQAAGERSKTLSTHPSYIAVWGQFPVTHFTATDRLWAFPVQLKWRAASQVTVQIEVWKPLTEAGSRGGYVGYHLGMHVLCLAFSILGCLLLSSCCANEAPSEHLSPDGEWKYVTFDRNCGATTGSNLQVTVLPAAARLPNEAGNTFIADDNHGAAESIARLEWLAPHTLRITISSNARVFKKESRTGRVEIRYVQQAY